MKIFLLPVFFCLPFEIFLSMLYLMSVLPVYLLPIRSAFLLFILFSFVGWCCEVLYVGIFFEHKFVNRGFLIGPLCPIYGFGGVVILLLPASLYSTWVPLFAASFVLCTAVEYFISWLLEKMFHATWWDYSHYKFNIKGRVCLLNSTLFGLMGMLGGHFIFPYAEYVVTAPPELYIRIISDVIAVILSADIIVTVRQLVDFNTSMERIKMLRETIHERFEHEEWFKDDSLAEMLRTVKEHIEIRKDAASQKLAERIEKFQKLKHTNIERLLKKFPTMKSVHYREEIKLFREKIRSRINSKH